MMSSVKNRRAAGSIEAGGIKNHAQGIDEQGGGRNAESAERGYAPR